MDDDLKALQKELMNDIAGTESIISTTKELVDYLNLEPKFFHDLELTTYTLQELSHRISETLNPKYLEQFSLTTKQVRMMATDLLDICKRNMYSA